MKSNVDNCDMTEAFRRFTDELKSLQNGPLEAMLLPFDIMRGNVGLFGIPLFIELMATSEKFFRNLRSVGCPANNSVFISGKSSFSSSFTVSMCSSEYWASSTSITSSFKCLLMNRKWTFELSKNNSKYNDINYHFTGCSSVDPNAACNASPEITRIAPLNSYASSSKRMSCGKISIPAAVPAIDSPTAEMNRIRN